MIAASSVIAYLAAVAAGRLVWGVDVWPWLGVPSGPSLFFDARNLTAAWECDRLGYDTLRENPCDPWGRPLNYPRVWLLFAVLGLDQSHTFAFAAGLIAVMFASVLLLAGRVTAGTGIVLALAACSPAVMFAVERANMDVAVVSTAAAAALAWRATSSAAWVLGPTLLLAAAVAKVYGAFAFPAFLLIGHRRAAWTATVCSAVFAVYCAANLRDIAHIARIAPQGVLHSYGARILPAHLYHQVGADQWAGPPLVKQVLAVVPLVLVAGAAAVRVRRSLSPAAEAESVSAPLLGLYFGALVYLGTFAVGNNFDYRLVFLLLTLPQLATWAAAPDHRLSSLAAITLAGIVLLLWAGSLSSALSLWDEVASWSVAGLLAAVLAATVPPLRVVGRPWGPVRAGADTSLRHRPAGSA